MEERPIDPAARRRLLECWLPLAHDVGASDGWADDAAALETVVLVAAFALQHARDADEARAILRTCHSLLRNIAP